MNCSQHVFVPTCAYQYTKSFLSAAGSVTNNNVFQTISTFPPLTCVIPLTMVNSIQRFSISNFAVRFFSRSVASYGAALSYGDTVFDDRGLRIASSPTGDGNANTAKYVCVANYPRNDYFVRYLFWKEPVKSTPKESVKHVVVSDDDTAN